MMATLSYLLLISTAVLVKGQGFAPAGFINEGCFNCLCEASSKCKLDIGCNSFGPGQYFCGPYQISYSYWHDSGSPGSNPDDPLDFEKCLNNRNCAEGAIRGYMAKYINDCDKDESVTCYDMARIHMAGPNGCNQTWVLKTDFWARFKACYES